MQNETTPINTDAECPAMILRPIDFVKKQLRQKSISYRQIKIKFKKLRTVKRQTTSYWTKEFFKDELFIPRDSMVIVASNLDYLGIIDFDFLMCVYDFFKKNAESGLYRYDEKLKCLVKKAIK